MAQRMKQEFWSASGLFLALAVLLTSGRATAQTVLGTTFTYQGRLTDAGSPANGPYHFQFFLYDAASGGTQVGSPITQLNNPVTDGLFTVQLDFGASPWTANQARWLEVEVASGGGPFTPLSPRQPLTAAPYALGIRVPFAATAGHSGAAFSLTNTGATNAVGLRGETTAGLNGKGVFGIANYSFGGTPSGVFGQSDTEGGRGVTGVATYPGGAGIGGYFESAAPVGVGVFGRATDVEGEPIPISVGVRGESASLLGTGVHGSATHSFGNNIGVRGESSSPNGYGGYFVGRGYFTGPVGIGTSSPIDRLDVNGVIRSSTGGFKFPNGTVQTVAAANLWAPSGNDAVFGGGHVGIGTSAPSSLLHLNSSFAPNSIRWEAARYETTDAPSQAALPPGVIADLEDGPPWTTPLNVAASDNARANVSLTTSAGGTDFDLSETLELTGFGFNLPPAATLTGVEVRVEGSGSCTCTSGCTGGGCNGCGVSAICSLVAGGSPSPTKNSPVASTELVHTLGSPTDQWGLSLTAAQVNAAGFGVRLAAKLKTWAGDYVPQLGCFSGECDCGASGSALIDSVNVTVYYFTTATNSVPVNWSVGIASSGQEFLIAPTADLTSPALAILSGGNVGIGTTTPSQKLHVNGNVQASCGILACSDQRFKKNIEPLADAMSIVEKLRGVSFDWNRGDFPDRRFNERRQVGFIAQEVEKVVPEIVSKGSDGYYSVDYGRLTPVIVEALHELNTTNNRRLAEKDDQIAELCAESTEMAARLRRLETAIDKLANEERGGVR